ncbi:chemotaxis protein CheD [Leptospira inadai]|nr:chemotaxis protein CheD [Leptospira inadai]
MTDRPIQRIYVGEYFFSEEPVELKTLLGSCVSVCLFDSVSRFGGMNHILLPGSPSDTNTDFSTRFGVHAMEILINEFVKRGIPRKNLSAKIIGGGQIMTMSPELSIGAKNIYFARSFLEGEEIPIIAEEVGGQFYRNLRFFSDTAEVFVRRERTDFERKTIERQEQEYLRELERNITGHSSVIFF